MMRHRNRCTKKNASETLEMYAQNIDLPVGTEIELESGNDQQCQSTQTPCSSTSCREGSTQASFSAVMSVENFMHDNPAVHFYTGLETFINFIFVLQSLGPAVNFLSYYDGTTPNLSINDQFFVTLIKLRQHKTNFELSRLFNITENAITNIFITWINFLACQWDEIKWWPDRDVVSYFAPSDFYVKFPSTRVIVDGTECPIKRPNNPLLQQATFSTYKNRNTLKVLIGCTPGGLVSYVSPAYAGSTSDRQVCERSPLTDICNPGDSIMADKGFNVQDMFVKSDVKINIPTKLKRKTVCQEERFCEIAK